MNPVIYRPSQPIAGVRPYFVLPREKDVEYFESCGGAPEAPLIEWATTLVRDDGTFVDVGAHVGTWSIVFQSVGRGIKVRSYEAQQDIYRCLKAGQALNNLSTHKTFNFAVTDYDGYATLQAPHADGGGGSIVCRWDAPAIQIAQIATVTLDQEYLLNLDLLKIDVEGAELDVLRGAKYTLLRCKPRILFECWADERGQRIEELFRFLHDELDYTTQSVSWAEMYLGVPK